MPSQISVMIADSQPVFRRGLNHVLSADRALNVVGEVGDSDRTLSVLKKLRADVLLLDEHILTVPGLKLLEQISSLHLPTRVVLMANSIDRQHSIRALRGGARGVIAKNVEDSVFRKAVHCVYKGEIWADRNVLTEWAQSNSRSSNGNFSLTARELDVVREILSGSSNREIASRFAITEHTVKRHLTNIFDKTGCSTRLELSLFAMHHQLVD